MPKNSVSSCIIYNGLTRAPTWKCVSFTLLFITGRGMAKVQIVFAMTIDGYFPDDDRMDKRRQERIPSLETAQHIFHSPWLPDGRSYLFQGYHFLWFHIPGNNIRTWRYGNITQTVCISPSRRNCHLYAACNFRPWNTNIWFSWFLLLESALLKKFP